MEKFIHFRDTLEYYGFIFGMTVLGLFALGYAVYGIKCLIDKKRK